METQKSGTPLKILETSNNLADNLESLSKSLEVFHNENKVGCFFEDSSNSLSDIEACIDDNSGYSDSVSTGTTGSEVFIPLDKFEVVDMKLNQLFEMYESYNKTLSEVKESISNTQKFIETSEDRYMKIVNDACNDAVIKFLSDHVQPIILDDNTTAANNNAKLLLEALQMKNRTTVDCMIETSLTELLQSDSLRDQMVSATISCLEETIRTSFSSDMSSMYLPLLDCANYRLLRRVSAIMCDAIRRLQVKACLISKPSLKVYRELNWSLGNHQTLVEEYSSQCHSIDYLKTIKDTVHKTVSKKINEWRDRKPNHTNSPLLVNSATSMTPLDFPNGLSSPTVSSSQFAIFDDIMSSKPTQDINAINKSFEDALSAEDVSRVVAVCKSHDATLIFTSCKLKQSVLLSLIQQLATDLLYETPLKLRYMEESIMNLQTKDAITHRYLPTVAEDVLNHLTTFLNKYPHHLHSKRVKMLKFAVESLLKINI